MEPHAPAALLLLCLVPGLCNGDYTSQELSTFVDLLLAEYDREVPPAPLTTVTLTLDVRHAAIDDQRSTMRLLADLKMNWTEPRLTWNASQWQGDSVVVPAGRLWAPDVELLNAAGGGGAGVAALRARVSAAGAVRAVQRLSLDVPVAMSLEDWPADVQQADFQFASRAHGDDEIELEIGDDKYSVVVESSAWEVVNVGGHVATWRRGAGGGAAARAAAWRVRVARRGAARALAARAALAAALLLLLAAAALPYSQRAPLAAAASFLAALWLVAGAAQVPGGAACPRVVRLLGAACLCAAACGACAAGAARLARRTRAPPARLRALLSRVSAVYALAPDPESSSGSKSGAWAAAAQLVDAVVVAGVLLSVLVISAVQMFS